jgi:hypothetical protein
MKGLSYTERMVIAWFAGLKDVTRRLMNPQPPSPAYELSRQGDSSTAQGRLKNGHFCWMLSDGAEILDQRWIRQAYTEGEKVYIKEVWSPQINIFGQVVQDKTPFYRAADGPTLPYLHTWHSPMLMPEWASRSKAYVASIRPEQIQSITAEEVRREGLTFDPAKSELPCASSFYQSLNDAGHVGVFRALWEEIHPGSWSRNDWVWRLQLSRIIYGG